MLPEKTKRGDYFCCWRRFHQHWMRNNWCCATVHIGIFEHRKKKKRNCVSREIQPLRLHRLQFYFILFFYYYWQARTNDVLIRKRILAASLHMLLFALDFYLFIFVIIIIVHGVRVPTINRRGRSCSHNYRPRVIDACVARKKIYGLISLRNCPAWLCALIALLRYTYLEFELARCLFSVIFSLFTLPSFKTNSQIAARFHIRLFYAIGGEKTFLCTARAFVFQFYNPKIQFDRFFCFCVAWQKQTGRSSHLLNDNSASICFFLIAFSSSTSFVHFSVVLFRKQI